VSVDAAEVRAALEGQPSIEFLPVCVERGHVELELVQYLYTLHYPEAKGYLTICCRCGLTYFVGEITT
jgi:hypothetical protein